MDLIRTGLGIKKTIQNVGRMREIITVFARNGFDEWLLKSGVPKRIPNFALPRPKDRILAESQEASYRDLVNSLSFRLRKSFEELGPSFIKLGQLLATREDIFPPVFINEMRILQDKVKGIEWEVAKDVIEKSLQSPIDHIFTTINPKPIGTASIGVVYEGQLKSGEEVVIKVRRPHIGPLIRTDFDILYFLIVQIEKVSPDIRYLGLSKLVEEFRTSIESELDFQVEALSNERFRENVKKYDGQNLFYVPQIYRQFLSEELLVMERIRGIPFSDSTQVGEIKEQIGEKLTRGLVVFVNTILRDGFFHADLHGGNFFLMPDQRIGIIDFGLMGSLGKRSRLNFVAIVYAMINHDYDNVVYEFLDVAEFEEVPDVDTLIRDVRSSLSSFVGLTVQQINMPLLFREIVTTLGRHKIFLPREWFIVFRALTTLDGVGKSLKMDFDLYAIMHDEITSILEGMYSKEDLIEEGIWLGRDLLGTLRLLPRHIKWFLRDFSKKGYALEIKNVGYERHLEMISHSLNFVGHCVVSAVCLIAGVLIGGEENLVSYRNVPLMSWVFWGLGLALFLKASFRRRDN